MTPLASQIGRAKKLAVRPNIGRACLEGCEACIEYSKTSALTIDQGSSMLLYYQFLVNCTTPLSETVLLAERV
jgi:hypothetical protein